ncbi:VgrG-related protein [Spirulina subsalsa FACHB-351]|uniref:VgrG-related protein n=1 Tax=Spirulina subsalsa FACHB-351 TaxID=234711 RepID=A0ABT3L3D3_9CYAN|nr:VgrG-related protein [Spirulina subsalsa]MCW6036014.1 VgrG-related protein [Spirulina subsalsa FACHB-351]
MIQAQDSSYVAVPFLQLGGQDAPKELMNDLEQITVEESLHLPAMFTIVVENPYFPGQDEDKPWRYDDMLKIGQTVRIGFQSSTTQDPDFSRANREFLIEGEITGIESHFSENSQAPVLVRGYDISHRLHRGRYNRSFQNYTDSDIVREIAREVGINVGGIDASGDPHEYVFQENQTNMEFLRHRAARIGFELFVQDGKLYFRRPQGGENLALTWLKDFGGFRVRVTSAEQVSGVEVRGWDYGQKKAIVGTAQREQVITQSQQGRGSTTGGQFGPKNPPTMGATPPPKMIVVDQPVFQAKEADAIAQSLFNELGGAYIYADATGEGNPKIRTGRVVKLQDMGKYDGQYYITATRHVYYQRSYRTEFSVRGLRGGDLFSILSPKPQLKPGQTFLVGIVTDNKDPQGWGRVRVKFPTLTPEEDGSAHASNWARVVALGAGDQRGFDCLPEINDEVLVGFEHGDIHRPYVVGGVWNGKDKPPVAVNQSVENGKVRVRTLKTRTGHQLQFVEEDKTSSKRGISLQTAGKHEIQLKDSNGDRAIEIKTSGGHKIILDETNGKIEIISQGRQECILNDRDRSITLKALGTITIQGGASLNLNAAGGITLKAGGVISVSAGGATTITSGGATTITSGGANTLTGTTNVIVPPAG